MRKIIVIIFLALSLAGSVYAQTAAEDQAYKDLAELRRQITRMKKEMNKFVKDLTVEEGAVMEQGFGQDVKVDVTEDDKNMMVKADLPGMEKDKIQVVLEKDRILKISGEREVVKQEETKGVVKQERSYGSFARVLELPADGMTESIKASYRNGVLEIVIPKKKIIKQEAVKINVQ